MIRLFIVGCSRSGTSIVQRELYKKLGLYSLPETSFFLHLKKKPDLRNRLSAVKQLLTASGRLDDDKCNVLVKTLRCFRSLLKIVGPFKTLKIATGYHAPHYPLVQILDALATDSECAGWVEKTPLHFRHMETLLGVGGDPKVLFVIRKGLDVVASIKDRHEKYPNQFRDQSDKQYAIELWNESVSVANEYQHHSNVGVLFYEDFCDYSETACEVVQKFLDIPQVAPEDSTNFSIRTDKEGWKEGLAGKVKTSRSKATEYFSDNEICEIENLLDHRLLDTIRNSRANLLLDVIQPRSQS